MRVEDEMRARYFHLVDVSTRITNKIVSLGDSDWDRVERRRLDRILEHHVYPEMRRISFELGLTMKTVKAAKRGWLVAGEKLSAVYKFVEERYSFLTGRANSPQPVALLEYHGSRVPAELGPRDASSSGVEVGPGGDDNKVAARTG